ERDREVVLLGDLRRGLDPELPDDVAVDVEPENLLGLLLGIVGTVGELDPAGLAAPARQHLGLDDDLSTELLRRDASLRGSHRGLPCRRRDPEAPKEFLALVLVEIHRRRTLAAAGPPERRSADEPRPLSGNSPPFGAVRDPACVLLSARQSHPR